MTDAADDVIEINRTTPDDVIVTSSDHSNHSQPQQQTLDNYSVWTARMNEANMFFGRHNL